MQNRPPIVVIVGHVDHGKTTLLDYIRKSALTVREIGGITQKIGAYEIDTKIAGYDTSKITFIDTPGHEAFTKIRSRGVTLGDIAILIIDSKDSIMPQTIESINIIKESKIPFIVALNKADLPDAKPDKVKNDLLKFNIQTEDKGGNTMALPISGKTGMGVPELLEAILLLAHTSKLTTDVNASAEASVIETKKDKRGIIASCIITNGTLNVGDTVYSGLLKIKIRSLINDKGEQVKSVTPCTPFELLGFESQPEVGTTITAIPQIQEEVKEVVAAQKVFSVQDIFADVQESTKKLSLIIKADSQGSLEAILAALEKQDLIEVQSFDIGEVNKQDIFMAKTTKSIVIGFSTKVSKEAQETAKDEKVVIKTYDIIYEMLEELEEVSFLMQEKENAVKNLKGEAKVLATFKIDGETAYGLKINKGKVSGNDMVEVFRDDRLIGKTKVSSLRIRSKVVTEVKKGDECGMLFYPALDITIGDIVKCIS
jgi:translation initiation factor IF-2